ncbi:PAS domain S-box-containing protein [Halopelagius inordinatus]|uniref:histidine kinase n=1 Tax=Halopelagius inordinatus TaxID=553467 RepID=A0A1I2LJ59_9EURY|nr:PAS domain S-box protein [Halopelagius inordinatus]SFF77141.1 PAS domain S-box-containing protein [Halopelagius inordinatus]
MSDHEEAAGSGPRTERTEAEALQHYRTLANAVDDGIYRLDAESRFVAVNDVVVERLGYAREELLGEPVSTILADGDAERVETLIRDLLASDEDARTVELPVRTADGGRVVCEVRVSLLRADGEFSGTVGVARDISERTATERRFERRANEIELERYKQYTDDVLDAVDDIFYILDEDGHLRRWNESLCEVSGYADDEVRSMHALEFFDSGAVDSDDVSEAIRTGFETGHTRIQANVLTKDGDSVPYEFYGASLEDPDGNPVIAGIGRDVTERKETKRRLEESNERLEQFAYAASHDLQEPLRMVSSYLSLVDRRYGEELDDDAAEFIEYAVDGAERMRDMIDALLTYSRVEMRGDDFDRIDLETLLEDVQKNLELKIEETEAEVTVESLPRVHGDRGQLQQVFQNLLSNALEYSGDARPRVHVSATRRGSEWALTVRDEGIGIDPKHADRIFEVFQRLHTRDEHPGTGIGLALCRRIVERHGGRIWADSESGEGSAFRFTLPAAEGRDD